MARTPQPWKEAATLIIAAKSSAKPVSLQNVSKPLSSVSKKVLDESNYKLLLLKRSSESKFMPNAYVFPGGLLSDTDYSDKWAQYYTQALGLKSGTKLTVANLGLSGVHSKKPAPMYGVDYSSQLPNEAIFRLCAIRETFEESGLLIGFDEQELQMSRSSGVVHKPLKLSPEKRKLLPSLRKEVNSDDSKFFDMCRDLRVIPDIWGLVEHGNWLTPVGLKNQASRRYDTAFFMSFVTEEQQSELDDKEVTDAQWMTPADLLLQFRQGKLQIFPPQVHTLCELLTLPSWSELVTASLNRMQHENIRRILPVRIGYKDGAASLVNGDYQYPENPDVDGTQAPLSVDANLVEAHIPGARLHRFELRGKFHGIFLDTLSDQNKAFSVGGGHSILETMLEDLEIETDSTRKSDDISHIG